MKRYTHPDGGSYVIDLYEPLQMKTESGAWVPAIQFRRVLWDQALNRWKYEGKNHLVVTLSHWNERFTEAGDISC